MRKLLLLLLCVPALAQQIAPRQIQPGQNGQVIQTVSGVATWTNSGTTLSFLSVGGVCNGQASAAQDEAAWTAAVAAMTTVINSGTANTTLTLELPATGNACIAKNVRWPRIFSMACAAPSGCAVQMDSTSGSMNEFSTVALSLPATSPYIHGAAKGIKFMGCGSGCTGNGWDLVNTVDFHFDDDIFTEFAGIAINDYNSERVVISSSTFQSNRQHLVTSGAPNEIYISGTKFLYNGGVDAVGSNPATSYSANAVNGIFPCPWSQSGTNCTASSGTPTPLKPDIFRPGIMITGGVVVNFDGPGSDKGTGGLANGIGGVFPDMPKFGVQSGFVKYTGAYWEQGGPSAAIIGGGGISHSTTTAVFGSTASSVAVDSYAWQPTQLTNCGDADNFNVGEIWIGPPDYNPSSSSASSIGGGILQNEFEITGIAAFCNNSGVPTFMSGTSSANRGLDGTTARTWPVGAIVENLLPPGSPTIEAAFSHINAIDGPVSFGGGYAYLTDTTNCRPVADVVLGFCDGNRQVQRVTGIVGVQLKEDFNQAFKDGTSGGTTIPELGRHTCLTNCGINLSGKNSGGPLPYSFDQIGSQVYIGQYYGFGPSVVDWQIGPGGFAPCVQIIDTDSPRYFNNCNAVATVETAPVDPSTLAVVDTTVFTGTKALGAQSYAPASVTPTITQSGATISQNIESSVSYVATSPTPNGGIYTNTIGLPVGSSWSAGPQAIVGTNISGNIFAITGYVCTGTTTTSCVFSVTGNPTSVFTVGSTPGVVGLTTAYGITLNGIFWKVTSVNSTSFTGTALLRSPGAGSATEAGTALLSQCPFGRFGLDTNSSGQITNLEDTLSPASMCTVAPGVTVPVIPFYTAAGATGSSGNFTLTVQGNYSYPSTPITQTLTNATYSIVMPSPAADTNGVAGYWNFCIGPPGGRYVQQSNIPIGTPATAVTSIVTDPANPGQTFCPTDAGYNQAVRGRFQLNDSLQANSGTMGFEYDHLNMQTGQYAQDILLDTTANAFSIFDNLIFPNLVDGCLETFDNAVTSTGSPCGSGGGGGLTSFTTGTWPTWLTPSVLNPTSAPVLSVAASAIPNSALANSSTTVNGQTCTLGATCAISTSGSSGYYPSVDISTNAGDFVQQIQAQHVLDLANGFPGGTIDATKLTGTHIQTTSIYKTPTGTVACTGTACTYNFTTGSFPFPTFLAQGDLVSFVGYSTTTGGTHNTGLNGTYNVVSTTSTSVTVTNSLASGTYASTSGILDTNITLGNVQTGQMYEALLLPQVTTQWQFADTDGTSCGIYQSRATRYIGYSVGLDTQMTTLLTDIPAGTTNMGSLYCGNTYVGGGSGSGEMVSQGVNAQMTYGGTVTNGLIFITNVGDNTIWDHMTGLMRTGVGDSLHAWTNSGVSKIENSYFAGSNSGHTVGGYTCVFGQTGSGQGANGGLVVENTTCNQPKTGFENILIQGTMQQMDFAQDHIECNGTTDTTTPCVLVNSSATTVTFDNTYFSVKVSNTTKPCIQINNQNTVLTNTYTSTGCTVLDTARSVQLVYPAGNIINYPPPSEIPLTAYSLVADNGDAALAHNRAVKAQGFLTATQNASTLITTYTGQGQCVTNSPCNFPFPYVIDGPSYWVNAATPLFMQGPETLRNIFINPIAGGTFSQENETTCTLTLTEGISGASYAGCITPTVTSQGSGMTPGYYGPFTITGCTGGSISIHVLAPGKIAPVKVFPACTATSGTPTVTITGTGGTPPTITFTTTAPPTNSSIGGVGIPPTTYVYSNTTLSTTGTAGTGTASGGAVGSLVANTSLCGLPINAGSNFTTNPPLWANGDSNSTTLGQPFQLAVAYFNTNGSGCISTGTLEQAGTGYASGSVTFTLYPLMLSQPATLKFVGLLNGTANVCGVSSLKGLATSQTLTTTLGQFPATGYGFSGSLASGGTTYMPANTTISSLTSPTACNGKGQGIVMSGSTGSFVGPVPLTLANGQTWTVPAFFESYPAVIQAPHNKYALTNAEGENIEAGLDNVNVTDPNVKQLAVTGLQIEGHDNFHVKRFRGQGLLGGCAEFGGTPLANIYSPADTQVQVRDSKDMPGVECYYSGTWLTGRAEIMFDTPFGFGTESSDEDTDVALPGSHIDFSGGSEIVFATNNPLHQQDTGSSSLGSNGPNKIDILSNQSEGGNDIQSGVTSIPDPTALNILPPVPVIDIVQGNNIRLVNADVTAGAWGSGNVENTAPGNFSEISGYTQSQGKNATMTMSATSGSAVLTYVSGSPSGGLPIEGSLDGQGFTVADSGCSGSACLIWAIPSGAVSSSGGSQTLTIQSCYNGTAISATYCGTSGTASYVMTIGYGGYQYVDYSFSNSSSMVGNPVLTSSMAYNDNTTLGNSLLGIAAGVTANSTQQFVFGLSPYILENYKGTSAYLGQNKYFNTLNLNGHLSINLNNPSVSCSGSGTVNFVQPEQGSAFKKVVAYANNCTGTASFTFPTAFSHTPQIVTGNELLAAVVTSLSTTAMTITGSASTGYITVDGY